MWVLEKRSCLSPESSPQSPLLQTPLISASSLVSFLQMDLEEEGEACVSAGLSVAVWLLWWVPFRPSGQLEKGAAEGREW